MNQNETKLKGRDLINVGIYAAIYFVILMAVAMLGMIPIFLPLLSVLVPILGGTPRIQKRIRRQT
jgi:energy-coupling factor transport system substrate-specific component